MPVVPVEDRRRIDRTLRRDHDEGVSQGRQADLAGQDVHVGERQSGGADDRPEEPRIVVGVDQVDHVRAVVGQQAGDLLVEFVCHQLERHGIVVDGVLVDEVVPPDGLLAQKKLPHMVPGVEVDRFNCGVPVKSKGRHGGLGHAGIDLDHLHPAVGPDGLEVLRKGVSPAPDDHQGQVLSACAQAVREAREDSGVEVLQVRHIAHDRFAVHELVLHEGPPVGPLGGLTDRHVAIGGLVLVQDVGIGRLAKECGGPGILGPFSGGHAHRQQCAEDHRPDVEHPTTEPIEDAHEQHGRSNAPDDRHAAERGDQVEPRQKGPGDAAGGTPGVDVSDRASRRQTPIQSHLGHHRRDGAQQSRGQEEDQQHMDEHVRRPAQPPEPEPAPHDVVDDDDAHAGGRGQSEQHSQRAPGLMAIRDPSAEIVAHRDAGQHDADDGRPRVQRGAQIPRDQTRRHQLQDHDASAGEEHRHAGHEHPQHFLESTHGHSVPYSLSNARVYWSTDGWTSESNGLGVRSVPTRDYGWTVRITRR